jgi:hypothetical protein
MNRKYIFRVGSKVNKRQDTYTFPDTPWRQNNWVLDCERISDFHFEYEGKVVKSFECGGTCGECVEFIKNFFISLERKKKLESV